jgi:phenylalanyl-tRNA synthetase beta chain
MKIALDWIADYLSPVPSADVAADALMNAGLPVESITDAQGSKGPTKVLDVEVTSNRTDCFSHVGLARELSALCCATFSPPKITFTESGPPADTALAVDEAAGCPYYSARIIRNVKVGPSPDWLVHRLESIGLRSINNVVDITNYVLMELGQPLHAFDFDTLAEKRIIVRRAWKQEKLEAIDGKTYTLDPSMLVIADAERAVAIAGIMGGKSTEVTAKTTTILLESARFEPLGIRTTSRTLTLKSDSSYRFERGIDPTMADLASRRAAQLIQQLAGGEIAPGLITAGSCNFKPLTVTMRFKRFQEIVGISLSQDRMQSILNSLGFSPWIEGDALHTRIPAHRLDVDREIDLIEEVARVYGYSHIPTLDRVSHPVRSEPPAEKAARVIANAFVEAGFSEAVTVTFLPEPDAKPFAPALAGKMGGGGSLIRTQHAGWKGDVLRPSILPSLLAARRINQHAGIPDARLFERAETFYQLHDPATTPPTTQRMIAAIAGDLPALTGLLRLLADRLSHGLRLWVEPRDDFPFFTPGTSGEVHMANHGPIGRVGLFTHDLQRKYDLRHPAAGLELDWTALLHAFTPVRRANPVPRFPGIKRDLSIVIDEAIRWADLQTSIANAKLPALESTDFVTTFRNKSLGENKKSLTLTLDFRDPARTLTNEEVDAQVAKAVETLTTTFGATLRV